MTARTKAKLTLAASSIGLAIPVFITSSNALASINGPYGVDGNTVMMFHLDEAPASTIAVNAQAFTNSGIAFTQAAAGTAGSTSAAVLGQTATPFSGFGN